MKIRNQFLLSLVFIVSTFSSFTLADIVGDNNPSYAITGIQTQGVYYRNPSFDQPLIGARVTGISNQKFWKLTATLSDGTDPAILSDFKLHKTSVGYFASARATELAGTVSVSDRTITIDVQGGNYIVNQGDTIWLTAKVAVNAPRAVEIDVALTQVAINGFWCMINNESPTGAGVTYEFDRHVVPYYRMARVGAWNDVYYDVVSEVVFFYMGANADGTLYYGWEGGQYDETSFGDALETLRDGRGDRPVRILLGIAHCANGLSAATQNVEARARLVEQIIYYVDKFDFDGVDIDWEYPASAADWRGFEKLVAELKPGLFALGGGKMISSAMSNYKFSEALNTYGLASVELKGLHQQLDMLNMMTYDNGSSDGHSPWWLHEQSKDFGTRLAGLPPVKINVGLPFYTNEHKTDGELTWAQNGYEWVYNNFSQYIDATDCFWHGDYMYSYNSIATIRKKGADLRVNGYGAMIWGYECDIAYDNPKSLSRALASTIRPNDSISDVEITSAAEWGTMMTGEYKLTTDLTLTEDDLRPLSVSGCVDGQGYTVTLKGGGAAISGGVGATIKNLTIIVDGALSANGAVVDTLNSNGCVENVSVIVKDGASITGVNAVGGIVGDLYAALEDNTVTVKNCRVMIEGALIATGNGRVGGAVGNLNQAYATEHVRIQNCSVELYSTACLTAAAGTTHPGVGGLVGNCNTAAEIFKNNSVVLYDGALLTSSARIGALTGGNTWGSTLSGASNNVLLLEMSNMAYDVTYADQVFDFTIGEANRVTKMASVTYTERTTGVTFRVQHPVIFSASGYSIRLR